MASGYPVVLWLVVAAAFIVGNEGRVTFPAVTQKSPRGKLRAFSFGDPHIVTLDGMTYDFHLAGEYQLLSDSNILIQARHQQANGFYSVNAAVAIGFGKDRVMIERATGIDLPSVYLNDILQEEREESEDGLSVWTMPNSGGTVTEIDKIAELTDPYVLYTVEFTTGHIVYVLVSVAEDEYQFLQIAAEIPTASSSTCHGLWGNCNGDKADDLISRFGGGSVDPANDEFELIYSTAGSWKITEGASLFTRFNDETADDYLDDEFYAEEPTSLLPELDQADLLEAQAVCSKFGISASSNLVNSCVQDVMNLGTGAALVPYGNLEPDGSGDEAAVGPESPDTLPFIVGGVAGGLIVVGGAVYLMVFVSNARKGKKSQRELKKLAEKEEEEKEKIRERARRHKEFKEKEKVKAMLKEGKNPFKKKKLSTVVTTMMAFKSKEHDEEAAVPAAAMTAVAAMGGINAPAVIPETPSTFDGDLPMTPIESDVTISDIEDEVVMFGEEKEYTSKANELSRKEKDLRQMKSLPLEEFGRRNLHVDGIEGALPQLLSSEAVGLIDEKDIKKGKAPKIDMDIIEYEEDMETLQKLKEIVGGADNESVSDWSDYQSLPSEVPDSPPSDRKGKGRSRDKKENDGGKGGKKGSGRERRHYDSESKAEQPAAAGKDDKKKGRGLFFWKAAKNTIHASNEAKKEGKEMKKKKRKNDPPPGVKTSNAPFDPSTKWTKVQKHLDFQSPVEGSLMPRDATRRKIA